MTQREKGFPAMPDIPEDSWTYVTHQGLVDESATLMRHMAKMAETMRDHMYHLHKTHTVALMAADFAASATILGYTHEIAAREAEALYREVQKTLEIDDTIVTGHIPVA